MNTSVFLYNRAKGPRIKTINPTITWIKVLIETNDSIWLFFLYFCKYLLCWKIYILNKIKFKIIIHHFWPSTLRWSPGIYLRLVLKTLVSTSDRLISHPKTIPNASFVSFTFIRSLWSKVRYSRLRDGPTNGTKPL